MKDLRERVLRGIEKIRPFLQTDGGDISLIDISADNIVTVKLTGACHDCPCNVDTLQLGVEQAIKKEAPEIKGVVNIE